MPHLWQQADFNIITDTVDDALDGLQTDKRTDAVTDVRCCYCDQTVQWDYPPYSDCVCDVRIYTQTHNCTGLKGELGVCNPIPVTATTAEIGAVCDDLLSIGVTWVRVDCSWSTIEPSKGTFVWGDFDRFVSTVTGKGLKLLLILCYSVGWSNSANSNRVPPDNPQDYADFCAAVVARYAPQGVLYYQLWNEPNWHLFFKPTPDVAIYTNLIKAAYPAIKAVAPNAFVLLGGIAPTGNSFQSIAAQDFLAGVYANGGKGYFDAVAHHPYTYPSFPPNSAWRQMQLDTKNLRAIMRANGDGYMKIWTTEYGAPTGGGVNAVTEAQQANMLVTYITEARKLPWLGVRFIYCYKDLPPAQSVESYFGFARRYDNTKKPAYDAVKNELSGAA